MFSELELEIKLTDSTVNENDNNTHCPLICVRNPGIPVRAANMIDVHPRYGNLSYTQTHLGILEAR